MQRENSLTRQIHDLIQGSQEWAEFRLHHHGASEAAAMLGLSTKTKRSELVRMKATGIGKEFTDWVQENILDYGHQVEALARPLVEAIIGTDLYPVTCSLGVLSASCDGLDMSETIAFEHKQWNASLAAAVSAGELPDEYMPQCQQIMMVTGAERVVFTVSNGTLEQLVHMDVLPDAAWFDRIRAGWEQFDLDVAAYEHVEVVPATVAEVVEDLPSLSIRVNGAITLNSNLSLFGAKLAEFVENINKQPEDDQDFANAENAIKVLQRAEEALGAAEASALAQTADIDQMCKTVASLHKLARDTRLMMEKLVKARKETVKIEILNTAKEKQVGHIAALNTRLGKSYMPMVSADFATAMKGKKTVASLKDAADTELARFKIEANAIADKIQLNLATLRELGANHIFLFSDTPAIVLKANDDLTSLVKLRIAEHDAAEAAKAEALRAKIAAEEKEKAEAAAAAKLSAERKADAERQEAEQSRVAAETKRQMEEKAAAADTERKLNEQAIAAQAEQNRLAAVAATQQRATEQAAANQRAEAAAVPVGAAPELARTSAFYGDAPDADLARCADTAKAMLTGGRSLTTPALFDAADGDAATDIEIITMVAEVFGLTEEEAIERMLKIDFDAVRVELTIAT